MIPLSLMISIIITVTKTTLAHTCVKNNDNDHDNTDEIENWLDSTQRANERQIIQFYECETISFVNINFLTDIFMMNHTGNDYFSGILYHWTHCNQKPIIKFSSLFIYSFIIDFCCV